ncbi:unnamed protein product [Bathycoccus prasinos]
MNKNDTKLKVDALEWRVELPVASKAALRMKESKGDAMSAKSAADAQASAVLTLRGSRGSDSNATTTNVRLSEEDCVKLRDSMDEAAKRVKEVMEKYGGEEGEK